MGIMLFLYFVVGFVLIIVILTAILWFATTEHKLSDILKVWAVPSVCLIVVFCITFNYASEIKSKQGTFEVGEHNVYVYSDNDLFSYPVDRITGLVKGKSVSEFTQVLTAQGFTETR